MRVTRMGSSSVPSSVLLGCYWGVIGVLLGRDWGVTGPQGLTMRVTRMGSSSVPSSVMDPFSAASCASIQGLTPVRLSAQDIS